MSVRKDVFLTEALSALDEALAQLPLPAGVATPKASDLAASLSTPPQFSLGQAAIPCHPLAKTLRSAPPKIAQTLADAINGKPREYLAKVDAVNGYLNFHCRFEKYAEALIAQIRGGAFFQGGLLEENARERISVEFSQPNTHKALHVGHLRNMIYGDAVCNLLQYAGHEVVRVTYPGDMGTHIAKTLWFIETQVLAKGGKLPTSEEADWLGKIYIEADGYATKAEGTPEEAQVKAGISKALADLEGQRGETFALYRKTREWSLEHMRHVYQWLGIHFDVWYYESECDEPSRKLVLQKLQEGVFKKSEGAVGLDLSPWNLGFAMVLKSDGSGLYLTKDIELIRRKFEDPRVTRSLVIVDARQKLHFQQLFKIAEIMGYPQATRSAHLSYETVTTEEGKPYSSRSLTGMPLDTLRSTMENKVIHDYLESYRGEWPEEEIGDTARAVALGALKYGFLRVDGNNVIRFVLNDWLKLDGDTGPYLQYVHARCASINKKLGRASATFVPTLETPIENELLFFLGRFPAFVLQGAQAFRPSVVASYLFDLCKLFNRFYTDCPIKTSEGAQRETRLALVEATERVLKQGLALLGIPAPNRM